MRNKAVFEALEARDRMLEKQLVELRMRIEAIERAAKVPHSLERRVDSIVRAVQVNGGVDVEPAVLGGAA